MKKQVFSRVVLNLFFVSMLCFLPLAQAQFVTEKNSLSVADKEKKEAPAVRIAMVGDRTGRERKGVFVELVKKINLLNPDFVVSVGDNIQGCSEDVDKINAQWDVFENEVNQLNMPFISTPGNHDLTNKVQLEIYKKRYGNPYYHIVRDNILFMFISTEDPPIKLPGDLRAVMNKELRGLRKKIKKEGYTPENVAAYKAFDRKMLNLDCAVISDEQVNYFKKVLKENKDVRWTFVVMHKRAWDIDNISENWLKIEKMLSGRPYTVFGGHLHSYDYRLRNGNDYIGLATVGGGWGLPPSVGHRIYDHVLMITFKEGSKSPVFANVVLNAVLDKTDMSDVVCNDGIITISEQAK